MQHYILPSLDDFMSSEQAPSCPFTKTFEEAQDEPFVALHTSGSTGLPKLIVPTQAAYSATESYQIMPSLGYPPTIIESFRGKRIFVGLPPFHSAALFMQLAVASFFDFVPVLAPLVPLTADVVDRIHEIGGVVGSCLAPSIIEDIVNTPVQFERLSKLDFLMFGGGQLSKAAGDEVIKKTSLISNIGSTETMMLPTEPAGKEDWQYYGFSPCLGAEFRYHWEDKHDILYEMVIVRNQKFESCQAIFKTFPDLQEYPMRDVYSRHPTKPSLWLYRGRADDVIVFSNGEKINPLTMEGIVSLHRDVSAAIVIGQGRFQSSLLVEAKQPPKSSEEHEHLLKTLWPTIQRANEGCPAHGKISKDLVLFTTFEKPLPRAGKGTVQKKRAEMLYQSELDALYAKTHLNSNGVSHDKLSLHDVHSTEESLKSIVLEELEVSTLNVEDDLFALGLDSLKVANIVRHINASLEAIGRGGLKILPSTIYANPTVSQMASKVMAMTGEDGQTNDSITIKDRLKDMRSLFGRYAQDLPISGRQAKEMGPTAPKVVILTGSTGSVGSYLLDALLKDQSISKVYCFNRMNKIPPEVRQHQANKANGLATHNTSNRVTFLTTDTSQPYFGLSRSIYSLLLHSTTHILHNAWEVNFNLSLKSFEPHVNGVRQFIDFSVHSIYGASIFFISTISTVMEWPVNHTRKMPEAVIDDWSLPQPIGYAESKHVSERLLEEASHVSGVPVDICRVGQVAGPTSQMGRWSMREWFPSLVASSAFMGVIPENLGPMEMVDWVPVDLLANVILDLFLGQDVQHRHNEVASRDSECMHLNGSSEKSDISGPVNASAETTDNHVASTNGIAQHISATTNVYHAVNPRQTTYSALLPTILSHLPPETTTIPLKEWVHKLEHCEQNLAKNPAFTLLDFFKGVVEMQNQGRSVVVLDTEVTAGKSATLRGMGQVEAGWMEGWMRGWGF